VDTFIRDVNSLLDTTVKRELWNFLLPVIHEDQQNYAKMSIDHNMQRMKTMDDSSSSDSDIFFYIDLLLGNICIQVIYWLDSTSNLSITSQGSTSDKIGTDSTLNTSDTEKQSTISNRSHQPLIEKDFVKMDIPEKKKLNELPKQLAEQVIKLKKAVIIKRLTVSYLVHLDGFYVKSRK
jgi:hypothetical protein